MTGADGRRRVAVVTDSSACLPADEIRAHRIGIVPIVLVWNGSELRDGIDISSDEFWRRLALDPTLPSTSSMSPGEYQQALEAASRWADSVVCVAIPRTLATIHESAVIAADAWRDRFPVTVVEAGGAAMASGFPALLGARAAGDGATHQQVVDIARRASTGSEIMAILDSLEYVARSGRIPAVVARVADVVPSTFMFRLRAGKVSFRARFGSRGRVVDGMLRRVRGASAGAAYLGIAVHHGANRAEAEALAARVRAEFRPDDLYVTSFTAVMGAHVGPGLLGLSYCVM